MNTITITIHERAAGHVFFSLKVGKHYAGALSLPDAAFATFQRQLCVNYDSASLIPLEIIDHTLEDVL